MSEFLHMGGYAVYVWSSYALALVILLANFIVPGRREKQLMRRLASRRHRSRGQQRTEVLS